MTFWHRKLVPGAIIDLVVLAQTEHPYARPMPALCKSAIDAWAVRAAIKEGTNAAA